MTASGATSVPPLAYSLEEFHGDLHHLLQPVVGIMRVDERNQKAVVPSAHAIERLSLILALTDLVVGVETVRTQDYDGLRDMRARHGCGHFQQDDPDSMARLEARHAATTDSAAIARTPE